MTQLTKSMKMRFLYQKNSCDISLKIGHTCTSMQVRVCRPSCEIGGLREGRLLECEANKQYYGEDGVWEGVVRLLLLSLMPGTRLGYTADKVSSEDYCHLAAYLAHYPLTVPASWGSPYSAPRQPTCVHAL